MAGPFIDQARWKSFLSKDEADAVAELEAAANLHLDVLKVIRANLEVYRQKHAWKTRKTNPYKGTKE